MSERSASPVFELLIIFIIVFLSQWVAEAVDLMTTLFVLSPPIADHPWTVVTSVYAHGNVGHLLSNSIALVIFGWPVARATTRVRFHVFFLVMGALAGISEIVLSALLAVVSSAMAAILPFFTIPTFPPTGGVLGASGAVFALMGYLLAGNRFSSGIASVIQIPQWLAWVVFLGFATAITLATAAPGVALIAHFTGFLLGLLAGRARVLNVGPQAASGQPQREQF
ncbi:rhomboid family intramembrane serine protease [Natronolimnobius sp. AArcel1]|uniref:rhomboid family intramembrane serine protease n=1 Tax=Natronolimnobius sp. AArcel1 TaxID=1679093 RepID=UPI0013ED2E3E|nr:rhomboid family intramembrane serine protease [Natronolimnobius sp. AArcel1]NGM69992.1 rhomboid family intramembrane serine protease [Natronolimnobius sp. AArcel1]